MRMRLQVGATSLRGKEKEIKQQTEFKALDARV